MLSKIECFLVDCTMAEEGIPDIAGCMRNEMNKLQTILFLVKLW